MSEDKSIPTFIGFENFDSGEDFVDLIRKKQQKNEASTNKINTDTLQNTAKQSFTKPVNEPPLFEFPTSSSDSAKSLVKGFSCYLIICKIFH
jgi:hypothetical protein